MTQLMLMRAGRPVRLGQELGRGAEGGVLACDDPGGCAAKVYSTPPDKVKVEKLRAMVQVANPALLKMAAWPTDLLVDNKDAVRGFVMPRVTARRNIHELYSPKSRAQIFPQADFRFLTHVCANVARAFAVVHESGLVIGDVNHGNLLVGPDGTVVLIDCDSFQLKTRSKVFTCDLGTELFTPPELQGRGLRGLERTPDHDRFGLAVLLFHLLFMGRHPFAGRFSGSGEMPIEKAIAEYRFAYGPDRALHLMERPPGTIPLEAIGTTVAGYFVRAFSRAGSKDGRPDAKAWIPALVSLKDGLQTCPAVSRHYYPSHLSTCPWCNVERRANVRLFGQRVDAPAPSGMASIANLWQAIVAVPAPPPDPPLPSDQPWICPPGKGRVNSQLATARKIGSLCLASVGLLVGWGLRASAGPWLMLAMLALAIVIFPRASGKKRLALERTYKAAEVEWKTVCRQWRQQASETVFVEKVRTLDKARVEITDLPNQRMRRLANIEGERALRQKQRYLDRFRIDNAGVRAIGPGRMAMLAAYGIETAADIAGASILQIPGFGPGLTSELASWRQSHEKNFRFNPNEPADLDIESIDRELEARRQELLEVLRNGPEDLKQLRQDIIAARPRLLPRFERAWNSFKLAEAQRRSF